MKGSVGVEEIVEEHLARLYKENREKVQLFFVWFGFVWFSLVTYNLYV